MIEQKLSEKAFIAMNMLDMAKRNSLTLGNISLWPNKQTHTHLVCGGKRPVA